MGALSGIRIVEMAGIGPAPFCGMLLADMGAEVLRVDRLVAADIGIPMPPRYDLLNRNKHSVAVDVKSPRGRETVLRLVAEADALIEGFRPGVMERLGLGPDPCLAANPKLVYGRMTGWGQTGPLSQAAAHDINYLAITGALHAIGRAEGGPVVPLNLVGDFGGGALYLAMGMLAALLSARTTGVGQVVDAAISDGVANLLTMHYGYRQAGEWSTKRASNLTDGGAPFYDVYLTKDERYVAVGAVEEKFYRDLMKRLGLSGTDLPDQHDRVNWPAMRERLQAVFRTRTREEWCALLEGTDACFAGVFDMDECVAHPHNQARRTHLEFDGVINPAPAPRFSATPSELRKPPPAVGEDTDSALRNWRFSPADIESLRAVGAIR
jgi:alpha-methylacyl-CoA racemase